MEKHQESKHRLLTENTQIDVDHDMLFCWEVMIYLCCLAEN